VSRSGVLLNTVTAIFQFAGRDEPPDARWVAQHQRNENPRRRMPAEQAEACFESLDAFRISQCDIHHLWRFAPLTHFS
jgi:hypothetical protein